MDNLDAKKLTDCIRKGANLEVILSEGKTLLHVAAGTNLMYLLSLGAIDVNARDAWRRTPLHCAVDLEEVELCVAAGADVFAVDAGGNTARVTLAGNLNPGEKESVMNFLEYVERAVKFHGRWQLSDTEEHRETVSESE
jgi:hypothetical protein